MEKKVTVIGQIKEGAIELPNRASFIEKLKDLKNGQIEITIRPYKRHRSGNQLRYYWSVVVPEITDALKALGHETDHDTTHELLKSKFNSRPICNADGEVIGELPQTTTRLNITEFSEYIERIVRWAAQFLGLVIPPPNSQTEMFGE